ncbi:hypothetical protein ScPMuIL_003831 [Solemya velum]
MVVLALLPYVVFQRCVSIFLISLAVLYGLLTLIKRSRLKKIDVNGQGVLVTGCDTGFGHHLARRLDGSGFTVYAGCLYEHGDGADTLRTSDTGRMHVLPLDVTSDTSVNSCLDYVTKSCGDEGIWAIVNNAGVDLNGHVEFITMEMYKRIAEVNQFVVVRVTKAFLPLVRKQKGRVLNVTSVSGRQNSQLYSAYSMTKFAAESFSDVLRLEMRNFGVKVAVIEPGQYGGVTGILKEAAQKQTEKNIETMIAEASQDVKDSYGTQCLHQMFQNLKGATNTSSTTVALVIDAMEDAIVNVNPQCRYLFFEGSFMVVLGLLPYIVFQRCVAMFLVALVVLYVLLRVIRRSNVERIAVHGQGVVITGCDTGFGHHLARRLDGSGFTVYAGCLDEHGDGADTLRTSDTGRMHVLPLDVTSDTSVNSCLEYVTKSCGDEGRVLNVTSVNGRLSNSLRSAYSMTKFAVESFSDVLRLEMRNFGVKVAVIEPGNYGGVTGLFNEAFQKQTEKNIETMIAEASQDVKDSYGTQCLHQMFQNLKGATNTSSTTVGPVIEAMENAIVNVNP